MTGWYKAERTDPTGYQGVLSGFVDLAAFAVVDSLYLPVILFSA